MFDDATVPVPASLLSTALPPGLSASVSVGLPPGLPVLPALEALLPGGLPRGQAVAVSGSVSLLLALLAAASADGAWCALVDLPSRAAVNAEALAALGLALDRVVVVHAPASGWSRAGWVTAVGALVDAFDVVAVCPGSSPATRPAPGDVQRLAARVRSRGAVLVPYLPDGQAWPGAAVRLRAADGRWLGIGADGGGRLRRRRLTVVADRRGQEARPRTGSLWLPAADGGIAIDDRSEEGSRESAGNAAAAARPAVALGVVV